MSIQTKLPADIQIRISIDKLTGCLLWRGSKNSDGYATAKLNKDTKIAVHRFMYEVFVGEIPSNLQLDHLCRVRHCVNPSHLEAVSLTENIRRGKVTILSAQEVHRIHKLWLTGMYRQIELGEIFGVGQVTISDILNGRNWRDIGKLYPKRENVDRVDKDLMIEVLELRKKGLTFKQIGQKYKFSKGMAHYIYNKALNKLKDN